MGINKEIWSTYAEERLFEKTPLVSVANRKFEGEAKSGSAVNVYTYPLTGEEVKSYNPDEGVDFTRQKPGIKKLLINELDSFAFRVENIDLVQNSNDSINEFLENHLSSHAKKIDNYLINLCYNKIENVIDMKDIKLNKDNIVSVLEEINIQLDDQNASDNRFVYLDGRSLSILRQANLVSVFKFEDNIAGPREVIKFGDRITILSSNGIKAKDGTIKIIGGTYDLINFVSQIEDIKDVDLAASGHFAHGVMGLYSYGAEVFTKEKGVILEVKDYSVI